MFSIRSLVRYMLFASCLTFSSLSAAITFGEIKVYSYLDEPLSAELELSSLEGIDPTQIIVSLGKPADFIRYGMQRPYFLTSLLFEIVTYQDKVLVYIRSTKVVTTPYLEFLIDFNWPTGGFIKDYTVLINPPPKGLSSANRPQPLSVIAMKESEVKSFGNELQAQLEAQETQANIVKRKAILPGQTSFSDESVYEAEEQLNAQKQEANVTLDPTAKSPAPGSAGEATTATTAVTGANTATAITAPAPAQATPAQTPDNLATPVPITPPAEFKQPASPANPPSASTGVIPAPPTSTSLNKVERSTLNYAIEKLQEADAAIGPTTDINRLTAARKKHLEMYKDIDPIDPDAEIDFGDVIKHKGASSATDKPGASPSSTLPITTPAAPATPAAGEGHMGFALLLVGFALGIVGVVGFGLKRGWHHKLLAKHIKHEEQVNSVETQHRVSQDLELDLDSELEHLDGMQQHEEIELTAAKLPEADIELDLEAIEKEIAKLGLDPEHKKSVSATAKGGAKTVSDLLNLGAPKKEQAGLTVANDKHESDTVEDIAPKKAQVTTTNTEQPLPTDPDFLNAEFKFDEIEIELSHETEHDMDTVEPDSSVVVPSADDIDLADEISGLDDEQIVPQNPDILNLSTQNELKLEDTHEPSIPAADSGSSSLRLEPEGASLLKTEPDPVALKMQLAKQYLEAGDKESAREILHEVIAIASDAQKLEAEMMLSGIL